MSDDINAAAAAYAGNWVKMQSKADGAIEGIVLSFTVRDMTFEGDRLKSRKTGEQRKEWVFVVQPDGGGEAVKFSLKEAGQRAVAAAIKDSGKSAKVGDRLKIGVKKDKESDREQPEYQARWTSVDEPLSMPDPGSDNEPF